ncbi:MAG: T9SS type A sorting domain-containing protein [Bacteroidota bacterium]|nr:T9SS type A sorting domain-containing protein [Bacteroidota bacterium]
MIYTLDKLLYHGDYLYKYFLVYNGVASWDNGEWAGDPNRELTVDTTMKVEDVWATLNPGISDVTAGPIISVYPNPASSVINVNFFEEQNIDRIEIYNLTGMLMKSVKGIAGENVSIDVSGFSKGTYLISVFENNNVQTAKFIIE